MSEPYLGQIQMFGFNFPPRGWAQCDGQTLPISQNSALFSLLGTIYGGDGRTTFQLPDLRGRAPEHQGQGPGLPNAPIGGRNGAVTHQLTVQQLPSHSHNFRVDCNTDEGSTDNPQGAYPGPSNEDVYSPSKDDKMGGMTTDATGNGSAFDIRGPRLTVNFCIALQGIFPSRS
ncbi:Phage Tail Collar Domain protein [Planctomycetes bacterium CA13]|uniref:Phage Tail Collar Domain protein n=1 Tax=Novipirellula herctigrandis TaxID=2527986 RepID=A0A5C5Z5Q0_9BACT|nr:Phage Tail Collar Domain protein [Planctomycetes bacterium CA13]